MKRSLFLNVLWGVNVFFWVVSCTYENNSFENEIQEMETKKVVRFDGSIEILLEYKQGVSEDGKKRIRQNYLNTGLLLRWEKCDIRDNENVEVWVVNTEIYYAKDPAPITERDKEDIERLMENANCEDYNEN